VVVLHVACSAGLIDPLINIGRHLLVKDIHAVNIYIAVTLYVRCTSDN
jgi:hypothetical protein